MFGPNELFDMTLLILDNKLPYNLTEGQRQEGHSLQGSIQNLFVAGYSPNMNYNDFKALRIEIGEFLECFY